MLGASASAETPAAGSGTNTTAEVVSPEQKILDAQRSIDRRLTEIERKLDDLLYFMGGGRQLSSFDTVDRRFREINDKLDRMQRDIDRLR
jgi:hypothetical protein